MMQPSLESVFCTIFIAYYVLKKISVMYLKGFNTDIWDVAV